MKHALLAALLGLLTTCSLAAGPALAPNAPKDNPVRAKSAADIDKAIAPYIAQAKASYPQAKQRFLIGVPKGQSFFLTTRLFDRKGNVEQVFVAVQSIRNGLVEGRIWSDIERVEGFRHGDAYFFHEAAMIDWLITKPDGTEEGNFVRKFLDTYSSK
ncbi:hypothetical protein ACEN8I_11710 [Polaromonas sp. CT11-55]|uniref:hypothetical protein n=1 Tax=Polaromonas sp. CT11-55 TaxID=3243045 RepID=UPI0039A69749